MLYRTIQYPRPGSDAITLYEGESERDAILEMAEADPRTSTYVQYREADQEQWSDL